MTIDIGIITLDKESSIYKRCFNSIVERTNSKIPFQIFTQEERVREAVNFNKLVAMFENPIVVYMNDDVEIIDDEWLEHLYSLVRMPKVGLVGVSELYTDLDKTMYLANKNAFNKIVMRPSPVLEVDWAASYLWMWNRDNVSLAFDEDIPTSPLCGKGMTDVDMCIALRENGWNILKDFRHRVYHEHKAETQEQFDARLAIYAEHVAYMENKWGAEKFKKYMLAGLPMQDLY